MQAISIREVTKQFQLNRSRNEPALRVLEKISLSVKKGEFVGIIGPNGCGKSTLFKLILGLEKPDSGEITVLGKKPDSVRIGYVPQHSAGSLFPWFTTSQNMAFAVEANKGGSVQLVEQRLEEFGVLQYANAFPYQLSGGFKQLASVARATLCSDIFLLDEPFNGLDFQNRLAVEKKLFSMRNGKNTVLLVSHDIESTLLLCDKIMLLSEKPTRIKAVLSVPLPSQRSHQSRFHPEFQRILNEIYSVLLEEKP